MSEEANQNTQPQLTPEQEKAARAALMDKAKLLGLEFSNNIGTETLRQRIREKMEGSGVTGENQSESHNANQSNQSEQPNPFSLNASKFLEEASREEAQAMLKEATEQEPVRQLTLNEYLRKEKLKLVRCRIYCLNPSKNDLPGEIITVANEHLGTVRHFVPFGERTDDGWHIPQILFDELSQRKYLHVQTKSNKAKDNVNDVKTRYMKEFSLEVLEPLSKEELRRLAVAQLAAGGTMSSEDDED